MEALIQEMLDGKILLAEAVEEFEKIYIEQALERNGGRLTKTAETLGIHRNTLSAKVKSYKESKSPKAKHPSSRKRSRSKTPKARAASGSR